MTHQAGRELDARVAEKVMGFIPTQETFESHHNGDEVTVTKWCLEDGRQIGEYGFCPHYSTSIEAAWEIVEKLHLTVQPYGGRWSAGIKEEYQGGIYWDFVVEADTAPLAICLAALKAVV